MNELTSRGWAYRRALHYLKEHRLTPKTPNVYLQPNYIEHFNHTLREWFSASNIVAQLMGGQPRTQKTVTKPVSLQERLADKLYALHQKHANEQPECDLMKINSYWTGGRQLYRVEAHMRGGIVRGSKWYDGITEYDIVNHRPRSFREVNGKHIGDIDTITNAVRSLDGLYLTAQQLNGIAQMDARALINYRPYIDPVLGVTCTCDHPGPTVRDARGMSIPHRSDCALHIARAKRSQDRVCTTQLQRERAQLLARIAEIDEELE